MEAEAIAELDAEDSNDDDCYITRPDNGFTPPKGFVYKNPVLCAAHVVGIADPAMYGNHSSHNNQEHYNKQLKFQHEKEKKDLETPAESLYNAQGKLAFERARFRADCAARAIRNAADAEKHKCRIAVARAKVVRQKKKLPLHVTLPLFILWAGGTGGARRQPATNGIY